jgi:hypothetical protein
VIGGEAGRNRGGTGGGGARLRLVSDRDEEGLNAALWVVLSVPESLFSCICSNIASSSSDIGDVASGAGTRTTSPAYFPPLNFLPLFGAGENLFCFWKGF